MSKKKVVKPKTISVRDMKAWLNGILEFQTDEWVPDRNQWLTIKEKIFSLDEGQANLPVAPMYNNTHRPAPQYDAPHPMPAYPVAATTTWPSAAPTLPSSLDMGNDIMPSGQPTQKTPNIDTSKNGYNSGFE